MIIDKNEQDSKINNDQLEILNQSIRAYKIVEKITEHPLRLSIFILLYIYNELNVSEISKKLHKSKATVSRHLKELEKSGILKSRSEKTKGKINPKYYRLPKEILYLIKESTRKNIELNEDNNLIPKNMLDNQLLRENIDAQVYKSVLLRVKSIATLIKKGFFLIDLYIKVLEEKINNPIASKEIFTKIIEMFKNKLNFDAILIDENSLTEVKKLYKEFLKEIYNISDKNNSSNSKSILMINTFLPLKEIIEFKLE
ncbi:MAG: ArsR/SmtB family transcription factor [Promethearchaeota archaeon]